MNIRMKLATVAAFAAALPAFAQIKINDNLSVTGWSVGSYQYSTLKGSSGNPNVSTDSFNVDAALLGATITPTKEVTATVSLYYRPSGGTAVPTGTTDNAGVSPSGSEATLLDAYVAYNPGNGALTVTAGKFLSYLGYESFYQISDNMITLANQQFLAPIPGYHEGVKIDYVADKTTTVGAALVDSLYSKPGYNATEGDGELKHNAGAEAYIQYTGINNLTIWGGAGYTTKGGFEPHDIYVLDLWASYQIDKASSVALEEIYSDGGLTGTKGSNWLAYYQYNFTDKWSSWFCFSGEDVTDGSRYWKLSLSPTYAFTANLSGRFQYSYTKYGDYTAKNANFVGAEVLFKF